MCVCVCVCVCVYSCLLFMCVIVIVYQIKASQADLTVTETTPETVPVDKEGSSINASQTEL